MAHVLQRKRFQSGDFSLVFEGLRWFQKHGKRYHFNDFTEARQFLNSREWDLLVDQYINDQLVNHPNNMQLLDRYMPYAPRAFSSLATDSPSSVFFQLKEAYRSPDSHDGVYALSSNVRNFRADLLSAHPSPPQQKNAGKTDGFYASPNLDGCVQKGLSVGQSAAWTVEFVNDVRILTGVIVIFLPRRVCFPSPFCCRALRLAIFLVL